MTNYFYYIGVPYLFYLVKQMFDSKNDKKENITMINNIFSGNLQDFTNISKIENKFFIIKKRVTMKSLEYWIGPLTILWNIIGYIFTKDIWFLANLIGFLFFGLLVLIESISLVFQKRTPSKDFSSLINMTLVGLVFEFIVVTYILYSHFF